MSSKYLFNGKMKRKYYPYTTVTLLHPPLRPASCQPLSSSASAAAHLLIVVFAVVVVSTVVAPPPPTIRRVSSAAVILQTVASPTQPPRPASCQPSLLSAFAVVHLLIVVFCHCCQRRCSPSAANCPPRLFTCRCPPPHLPLSSTSSYRCPYPAAARAAH